MHEPRYCGWRHPKNGTIYTRAYATTSITGGREMCVSTNPHIRRTGASRTMTETGRTRHASTMGTVDRHPDNEETARAGATITHIRSRIVRQLAIDQLQCTARVVNRALSNPNPTRPRDCATGEQIRESQEGCFWKPRSTNHTRARINTHRHTTLASPRAFQTDPLIMIEEAKSTIH